MYFQGKKPPLGTRIDTSSSLGRGLVGCWLFNEGAGMKLFDISGYNNTGTLTNMEAADWVQGKRGKALSFDGSDEYVDLGTSAGNFNNTDSFSVSAWINANTLNSTNRCIVNRVTGSQANGWEMRITTANKVRFILASTDANYNGQDTTVLSTNTWYHVVGTWNGSDAKIFLNGVEDTSTPITQNSVGTITGTRTLAVGANAITSSSYFPGSIDDVRIYNRALTAQEVKELYVNPNAGLSFIDGGVWEAAIGGRTLTGVSTITGLSTLTFS